MFLACTPVWSHCFRPPLPIQLDTILFKYVRGRILRRRADMVDEYIAVGKTLGIAEHNERALSKEGKEAVKKAFEATLALE